ncbi:MAG: rhomboid family intramembrane serine protease [Brachymonas sp.]|nr:rhomboid family intramembrane serine protease [Brachymonas sp.]
MFEPSNNAPYDLQHNPQPNPYRRLFFLPVVFIALNVAVWFWSVSKGVSVSAPHPAQLQQLGGNIALLTFTGEPWRLFTSMFLHAGLMHLAFNMFFLYQIGPLLVRREGNGGFALVYLAGGLVASIASAWWQARGLVDTDTRRLIVSVGASGAIMAVAGALAWGLVATNYLRDNSPPDPMANKQLTNALLRTIGFNVAFGFLIPGLDQSAHIGGLVAGALIGAVWPPPDAAYVQAGMQPPSHTARRLLALVVAVVLVMGFYALVLALYRNPLQILRPQLQ